MIILRFLSLYKRLPHTKHPPPLLIIRSASAFCPLPSSRLPSCLTPSPPGSSKPVKPTFSRVFRICLCPLPSALAIYHLVPHAVTPSPPPSQRPASASANRNFRFRICHLPITELRMSLKGVSALADVGRMEGLLLQLSEISA
ncbi:hypothetical protein TIFTF001_025570 [Ficus carica]|uniref:Uncharacterized protein n=1 Tax=Ficus carica TaxID=3494 RepID=A0AA88DHB2_FICCA|nr:hypothetical protein TIFTF001_025570 [Ficus carica]